MEKKDYIKLFDNELKLNGYKKLKTEWKKKLQNDTLCIFSMDKSRWGDSFTFYSQVMDQNGDYLMGSSIQSLSYFGGDTPTADEYLSVEEKFTMQKFVNFKGCDRSIIGKPYQESIDDLTPEQVHFCLNKIVNIMFCLEKMSEDEALTKYVLDGLLITPGNPDLKIARIKETILKLSGLIK